MRDPDQSPAWELLIEICRDECQVAALTVETRGAILAVEKEFMRLRNIENAALDFVSGSLSAGQLRKKMIRLVPDAFGKPVEGR